jgi:hypothetical protein
VAITFIMVVPVHAAHELRREKYPQDGGSQRCDKNGELISQHISKQLQRLEQWILKVAHYSGDVVFGKQ